MCPEGMSGRFRSGAQCTSRYHKSRASLTTATTMYLMGVAFPKSFLLHAGLPELYTCLLSTVFFKDIVDVRDLHIVVMLPKKTSYGHVRL